MAEEVRGRLSGPLMSRADSVAYQKQLAWLRPIFDPFREFHLSLECRSFDRERA